MTGNLNNLNVYGWMDDASSILPITNTLTIDAGGNLISEVEGIPAILPIADFISADPLNSLTIGSDGLLYNQTVVIFDDQVLTMIDTNTIDGTLVPSLPTGSDNQVNYTVEMNVKVDYTTNTFNPNNNAIVVNPDGLYVPNICEAINTLVDNGNFIQDGDVIPVQGCEKKTFNFCELVKTLPVGTFDPTAYSIQVASGVTIPPTSVGYDFDNANDFACSGGLPSTSEIGDFQLLVPPGGSITPVSPIPMTDVAGVNSFIASDLIPAINLALGTSYVSSDIVYQYDALSDIATVWYNPAIDPTTSAVHNWVIGPLGANSMCNKPIPSIATSTIPSSSTGCPELVLKPATKYRTTVDFVANVPLTITHNLNNNIGIVQSWHLATQEPAFLHKIAENLNDIVLMSNTDLTGVEITYMT